MDADFKEKRGQRICEKRWSMNSQRLEDILAQLMRPISNLRHCFDTDLCALLEEYLTEAGLHLLEEEDERSEGGERAGSGGGVGGAPNFAELALLLQQSANIYGHKVDFLYQHVLSVSDSLHNSITEIRNRSEAEEGETPPTSTSAAAAKRRRKPSGALAGGEFAHIPLERCAAARREAEAPRPPPTLPRMYIELEPRVLLDRDAPLTDYAGEPVGLLADFHVAWRLHEGLLVDELEGSSSASTAALRPIPLAELQAALEAAAPPPLSPLRSSTPLPPSPPPPSSTPLPLDEMPPPPPPVKRERKRKREPGDELPCGPVKILISKELRRELAREREFSVPCEWVSRVLACHAAEVGALRRRLRAASPPPAPPAHTGFPGWSELEAAGAAGDSDDDGFFEQSSLEPSDSEPSRVDDSLLHPSGGGGGGGGGGVEWEAWRAGVVQRAAAAEALGGVDVRALSAAVLRELPPPPGEKPFRAVLAACARRPADVSRLFLAALFLANAGEVRVAATPGALAGFALRRGEHDAAW